jgi:diguanylate cyclase (GGDEF)-like protein
MTDNNTYSILIVEDSRTQSALLQLMISSHGYSSDVVENGIQAIKYLENKDNKVDIIISDVNMPEMNGYELSRIIKEKYPDIFLIMLTADKNIEALKKSFECGAIDFICKPVNEIELSVRLNNVIRIKDAELSLKKILDELNIKNKMLHTLASTDALTGITNRRELMEQMYLQLEYALRYKTFLYVIMIDIDHFKIINDTYGHKIGDEVLIALTTTIRQNLRVNDIFGRYGGEEFIICLPNITEANAIKLINTHLKKVSKLKFEVSQQLKVTFSAGVYQYKNGDNLDTVLMEADRLLYKAKENGRNRIETE